MGKARQFFWNTLILTSASLVMRGVGLTFQLYLSRKVGTAGMGLFQLVMSVYGFAVTLSILGIRLAATRMVAEELGRKRFGNIKAVMTCCFGYALFFGCGTALLVWSSAPWVGLNLLGDARTILPLRLYAIGLPLVAISSALGGYFTAVRRVAKSAACQFMEQLVNITFTLWGLAVLQPQTLEGACGIIVVGAVLGEFISTATLWVLYRWEQRKQPVVKTTSISHFLQRTLHIALPVGLSAIARSGLSSAEHLLIPRGLRQSGLNPDNALTAYGAIHGMVLPLLYFPASLFGTVSQLLVPEFAECRASGDNRRIDYMIGRVLELTCYLSIGISGILYWFALPLGEGIYQNNSIGQLLRVMAPLAPALYLDVAVDGMLKGLGEQVASMRYNILDSLLGIFLAVTLLPQYGVDGYLCTIFLTSLFNFYLSIRRLLAVTGFSFSFNRYLLRPLTAILFALLTVGRLLPGLGGILPACGVYLFALTLLGCLKREDYHWMASFFVDKQVNV